MFFHFVNLYMEFSNEESRHLINVHAYSLFDRSSQSVIVPYIRDCDFRGPKNDTFSGSIG